MTLYAIDLADGGLIRESTFSMDEVSTQKVFVKVDNGVLFVRYGEGIQSSDSLVILVNANDFTLIRVDQIEPIVQESREVHVEGAYYYVFD